MLVARDIVEGERATPRVPAADSKQAGALVARGVPLERPDGSVARDLHLLNARLVTQRDLAVEHAKREACAVVGPAHTEDARLDLVLRYRLLLGRPEPEVPRGPRSQLLRDTVVAQALDGVIVAVLEDTLGLACPDDDRLVLAARGEALAILGVCDGIKRLLMSLERVQEVAVHAVVHEHPAADGRHQLSAIRTEGEVVDAGLEPVPLWDLVGPRDRGPHP
mmetsp:Transcript_81924/g.163133  ORF Transcript_81924/g.163133 Transcript_81924/m.163133 type:complete len:221 (+) Transcript_81924:539-1201(+)